MKNQPTQPLAAQYVNELNQPQAKPTFKNPNDAGGDQAAGDLQRKQALNDITGACIMISSDSAPTGTEE